MRTIFSCQNRGRVILDILNAFALAYAEVWLLNGHENIAVRHHRT